MTGQATRAGRGPAALGAWLLLAAGAAVAQQPVPRAGEVEFSRGVGFAQSPGQSPRTLGQGLPVREGDRLTTASGGTAIIRLEDGTRMTLRPNSELVLQQFQYKDASATDNGMVMQLLRGGFRAITGLIAKSSPNAARIQTSTATIGIRGTDFDARLCGRDCADESRQASAPGRPNAVLASARLVSARGGVEAVDANGQRRRLVDGGAIYPGDVVETGAAAQAVLAFRDESRVTLGAATRFRVDNFVFDQANAGEGRFLVSVLRGTVRALTGLIAKANNRNVGFSTATATIGVRGSGADIVCTGSCAGEPDAPGTGLSLWTWLGSFVVTPAGQTALQVLQAGQGLFITPAGIQPMAGPPQLDLPRPDGVQVPGNLFSNAGSGAGEGEGLYVQVRDGHIEVLTPGGVLHLGRNETGFVGNQGNLVPERPLITPPFLLYDRIPLPDTRNPGLFTTLTELGIRPNNRCE